MSGAQRLEKIYPALTARERGLLVLRAWKEGGDEDRKVRSTMPDSQVSEFNRYIALMNGVNQNLGPFVVILKELVSQLNLKRGWMLSLQLWGIHSSDLGMYIFCHTKEPICESDHAKLLTAARAEGAPVGELARVLAERGDGGDKLLAPKAEIARLVEEGAITGERKGRTLQVSVGSFYDWLGEPTPVYPEWGLEFEVFPDGDAEKVERLRRQRATCRDRLSKAPISPEIATLAAEVAEARSFEDEIVDGLRTSLMERIPEYWQQLRAIELVVEQVSAEFGGEDAALPAIRAFLDSIRAELLDLHSVMDDGTQLPEPGEETLGRILHLAQRDLADDAKEMTVTLPAAPSPAPPSAQSRVGDAASAPA